MAPKKPKRKLSAYNKHMSREMKKGRSFKQAVASWKGGGKSKPKAKSKSRPRAKTGGQRTVSKGGFNSQKIMKYIRLGALALPAVNAAMQPGISPQGKIRNALMAYTGYDMARGTFSFGDLAKGWTPYLASIAVTYGIPKLAGMIRSL